MTCSGTELPEITRFNKNGQQSLGKTRDQKPIAVHSHYSGIYSSKSIYIFTTTDCVSVFLHSPWLITVKPTHSDFRNRRTSVQNTTIQTKADENRVKYNDGPKLSD